MTTQEIKEEIEEKEEKINDMEKKKSNLEGKLESIQEKLKNDFDISEDDDIKKIISTKSKEVDKLQKDIEEQLTELDNVMEA